MCLKLLLKRLAKWPGVSALFLPLVTCEGICGDQERYAKMQSMNSWPTTACVEAEADLVPPIWVNVLDASRTSRSLSVFWLLFYLWNKDIQRLRITMIMMSRISRLFRIFWKRIHLQPPLYEQGTRYIYIIIKYIIWFIDLGGNLFLGHSKCHGINKNADISCVAMHKRKLVYLLSSGFKLLFWECHVSESKSCWHWS